MFKIYSFTGAEVVAGADNVGAVSVGGWVEVYEEREHFRRMASATKDDEEVGWGASFPRKGGLWVSRRKDVKQAELWLNKQISQQRNQ